MSEALVMIIVLFLVAMALIVAEICTPTFGVLGIVAVGCVVWAVYLSYTINGLFAVVLAIVAMIGLPVYTVIAVRVLPKTPLGKRLRLPSLKVEPGQATPESETLQKFVGRVTTAETVLRPSGMIRVDDMRIVAEAERGMIDKGDKIEIIRALGNRVVVRRIES